MSALYLRSNTVSIWEMSFEPYLDPTQWPPYNGYDYMPFTCIWGRKCSLSFKTIPPLFLGGGRGACGRLKTFLRNSFSQRLLCQLQAALSTSEHVISPIGETLILEIQKYSARIELKWGKIKERKKLWNQTPFNGFIGSCNLPGTRPCGPVRQSETWLKLAENTVSAELL